MSPSQCSPPAGSLRLLRGLSLVAFVALCAWLPPGGASAADKAGDYGVEVRATLTPDYVYTKTTDAPDLNLVILVNKKVVYSAAKRDGYKTLDSASWSTGFAWKPGDQVGLRLMDADIFSSDTIVEVSWKPSDSMPLSGTFDLSKVLGNTATGCSITFEVATRPGVDGVLLGGGNGDIAGPATTEFTCNGSRHKAVVTRAGNILQYSAWDLNKSPTGQPSLTLSGGYSSYAGSGPCRYFMWTFASGEYRYVVSTLGCEADSPDAYADPKYAPPRGANGSLVVFQRDQEISRQWCLPK